MKIKCEKLNELLTLKEQQELLDSLMLMEAIIIGHQEYLKTIGKLKESKIFVSKFIKEMSNEDFREKAFGKIDA